MSKACATHIKFDLIFGDGSSAMQVFSGMDKLDIHVRGFFTVAESSLEGGKTLYTLTETPQDVDVLTTFVTYKAKPEKPIRKVWADEDE